jgi:hypothetical protein
MSGIAFVVIIVTKAAALCIEKPFLVEIMAGAAATVGFGKGCYQFLQRQTP